MGKLRLGPGRLLSSSPLQGSGAAPAGTRPPVPTLTSLPWDSLVTWRQDFGWEQPKVPVTSRSLSFSGLGGAALPPAAPPRAHGVSPGCWGSCPALEPRMRSPQLPERPHLVWVPSAVLCSASPCHLLGLPGANRQPEWLSSSWGIYCKPFSACGAAHLPQPVARFAPGCSPTRVGAHPGSVWVVSRCDCWQALNSV